MTVDGVPGAGPEPAGSTFGSYRIHEELGRGTMGVVYRAVHREIAGREVALKVLAPRVAGDAVAEARFRREMEAVAAIDHPGVVVVHDAGSVEGRLYYAMALVPGETLAHHLERSSPCSPELLRWVAQVGRALGEAHRAGVIHRDVKPQNIVVSGSGQAVLTDFGLARVLDHRTRLTEAGDVLGTPLYMAPEQVVSSADVDGRADVFSLGCVLWHAAFGRSPYRAPTVPLILEALRGGCPRIPEGTDPALAGVLRRALSADPDARYPTADGLADDVEELLEEGGEGSGPGGRSSVGPGRRVARTISVLAILALLVGVGTGAWSLLVGGEADAFRARVERVVRLAEPDLELARRQEADGDHAGAIASYEAAVAKLEEVDPAEAPAGAEEAADRLRTVLGRSLAHERVLHLVTGQEDRAAAIARRLDRLGGAPALRPEGVLLAARRAVEDGRPSDALASLATLDAETARRPEALLLAARAHLAAGEPDRALAAAERVGPAAGPELPRLLVRIHLERGRPDRASRSATAAMAERGPAPHLLVLRARARLAAFEGAEDGTGRLAGALRDARRAGREGGGELAIEALHLVGRVAVRAGLHREALRVLDALAAADRLEPEGRVARALALHRLHRSDEALDEVDGVDAPRAHFLRGWIEWDRGEPEAARAAWRLAGGSDPDGASSIYRIRGLAGVEAVMGQTSATRDHENEALMTHRPVYERAVRFLEQAVARGGPEGELDLGLARLHVRYGAFPEALRPARLAGRAFAVRWTGHEFLARVLARPPALALARHHHDRAVAARTRFAEAHRLLGEARSESPRFRESPRPALAALRRAAGAGADPADLARSRAWVLLEADRPGPALEAARRAVREAPWSYVNHEPLLAALRASDEDEEADRVARTYPGRVHRTRQSAIEEARRARDRGALRDRRQAEVDWPVLTRACRVDAWGHLRRGEAWLARDDPARALVEWARGADRNPARTSAVELLLLQHGPAIRAGGGLRRVDAVAGPTDEGLASYVRAAWRVRGLFAYVVRDLGAPGRVTDVGSPSPDDLDAACREATRAIERRPGLWAAWLVRGLAHLAAGRLAWAERDLRTATEALPARTYPPFLLAACLSARGRPAEALDALDRCRRETGEVDIPWTALDRWEWFEPIRGHSRVERLREGG